MLYPITPVAKPRMTQRDRWKKRRIVQRYRAFKDECRLRGVTVPEHGGSVTFVLPMPKSWSKAMRDAMNERPHQQKPDVDNLLKGLLDAVYGEDCGVWDIRVRKRWGVMGEIMVTYECDSTV